VPPGVAFDGASATFSMTTAAVKPDGPSSMVCSPQRWRGLQLGRQWGKVAKGASQALI
jgi:hypothetical protein